MKKILISIVAMIIISINAFAINKEPRPKLCNTIFFADAVIHAKVVKHEYVFHPDDPKGAPDDKYYLRVIKTYRGKVLSNLVVISEMGVLNVSLQKGKEYILFPSQSIDGIWSIWDDQGEGEGGLIYSKENENKIHRILNKKNASIEGEIRDRNWNLMQGVMLTIFGKEYSRNVTTDKNGTFFVEVKPGIYRIVTPANMIVTSYSPDGTSPDPHNLNVQPKSLVAGQCMQIQLQEHESKSYNKEH